MTNYEFTEKEERALKYAVSFALREGIATDWDEDGDTISNVTNDSMVETARKLGLDPAVVAEEAPGDVFAQPEYPRCPECGDPIDFCQGHGENVVETEGHHE